MAQIKYITFTPWKYDVSDINTLNWSRSFHTFPVKGLPQIDWGNGTPWMEACLWLKSLSDPGSDSDLEIKTIVSLAKSLLRYANWIELQPDLTWSSFPELQRDQCLWRYKAYLKKKMKSGMAASTASSSMNTAVRFYRWVFSMNLLTPDWPAWAETIVGVRIASKFGLEYTLQVATTDLRIPRRKKQGGLKLEDGVLPVTVDSMRKIIEFAMANSPAELYLMLKIGFFTGLRLGSICDLKEDTLLKCRQDPFTGTYQFSVGPNAVPPVATKGSKPGQIMIPQELLEELLEYRNSPSRLLRVAKAAPEYKSLLFLTKHGNPYQKDYGAFSQSVHDSMYRLRKKAREIRGPEALEGFNFHRTRATFATNLMVVAMDVFDELEDAVEFVKNACMHADEKTTFDYIHFIRKSKAIFDLSEEYSIFIRGGRSRA